MVDGLQQTVISLQSARLSHDRRQAAYLIPADAFYNEIARVYFQIVWVDLLKFSRAGHTTLQTQEGLDKLVERYELSVGLIELIRINYLPVVYDEALAAFLKIHRFYESPEFRTYLEGFGLKKPELSTDYRSYLIINLPENLPPPTQDEIDAREIFNSPRLAEYMTLADPLALLRKIKYSIQVLRYFEDRFFEPTRSEHDSKIHLTLELWKAFKTINLIESFLWDAQSIDSFSDADILKMRDLFYEFKTYRDSTLFREFTSVSWRQRAQMLSIQATSGIHSQLWRLSPRALHPGHPLMRWKRMLGMLNEQLAKFDELLERIDQEVAHRQLR